MARGLVRPREGVTHQETVPGLGQREAVQICGSMWGWGRFLVEGGGWTQIQQEVRARWVQVGRAGEV